MIIANILFDNTCQIMCEFWSLGKILFSSTWLLVKKMQLFMAVVLYHTLLLYALIHF